MSRYYNSTIKIKYGYCRECRDGKNKPLKADDLCSYHYDVSMKLRSIGKVNDRDKVLVKPDKPELLPHYNLEKWFLARRKEMTGVCQCGCKKPSQKNDDKYFKHSCAHIFPKAKFKSVMCHPLNFVERAFWGGCHSVMDDTSMERWPLMADWNDIKEKFFVLASLLTELERATKFYTRLEKLIYSV